MGKISLTPVIHIDEKKCINCYACITNCPVKYCMDGSGEKLTINHDLCIGCGNCIAKCTHKARSLIDDTPQFLDDIRHNKKMIAVVAPAIAAVFPEKFLNFNGWLKSLGIEIFFDVSFGAEITVISYLEHIKNNKPRSVIAQPCPAICNFIQIYHPELIPYLAPADSPMLHTVKLIRKFYPKYKDHKIVMISPCIAKKREFDETKMVDYNVTMLALKTHMEERGIDLGTFPKVEYTGVQAERAVGFSSPGGLLDTAERFVPGIRRQTHKSEGVHAIYPFLEEMVDLLDSTVELPLLIDCLNCEKGCNGGPGTGNCHVPTAMLESVIRKRSNTLERKHGHRKGETHFNRYHRILKKYWKKGLYNRSYLDLSENNFIKKPTESQLTEIYKSLKKFKQEDIFDCTACGYGSCKSMATAIFNNLNKPANCAHYIFALLQEEMKVEELLTVLTEHISSATVSIDGINKIVHELSDTIETQARYVGDSSSKAETMVNSLRDTSAMSLSKQEDIKELIANAQKGQESMKQTIASVQGISQSVDGIASAIKIITSIAANTNLLSMNAAIEAAHAGDTGSGFAVVAEEIRRLSENTRDNSRNISITLKKIIDGIALATKQSADTDEVIVEMSKEINDFAQTMNNLINTFNNLSSESNEITHALDALKNQSNEVKSTYAQMLEMTDKLSVSMHELTEIAKKKETLH